MGSLSFFLFLDDKVRIGLMVGSLPPKIIKANLPK